MTDELTAQMAQFRLCAALLAEAETEYRMATLRFMSNFAAQLETAIRDAAARMDAAALNLARAAEGKLVAPPETLAGPRVWTGTPLPSDDVLEVRDSAGNSWTRNPGESRWLGPRNVRDDRHVAEWWWLVQHLSPLTEVLHAPPGERAESEQIPW